MKINKVKLYNFSSYEGKNEFDFEITEKEKNIILIGGKNGAGKTSLFTAIKVALYGPLAFGYVGINPHYIARIKDLINSKAFQQETVESEVQITLQLKIEREIRNYTITRKWDYTSQKLYEKYSVIKEGLELDKQELSYFENYLQSIIPPDLFEFFLFDGEEVGNIFSTSAYNTYVRNAVFTLCGMDVFEIIRKYTNGYVSKNSGDEDNDIFELFENTKNDIQSLEAEKNQLEGSIGEVSTCLDDVEVQLAELETAFKNAGGILRKDKEKLEEEFRQLEKVKTEALASIKMFVEGIMPFYILKDFANPIRNQLDFEEKGEIYYYVQSKLKRNVIEELLKDDISDKKIDQLMNHLLDTFRPKGFHDNMEMMFDLSKEDIGRVNGIVSAIEDFDVKSMIATIKRRRAASDRTAEINCILRNSMSEEDANIFTQKENEILKLKDDLTHQLFESERRLEEIERELQTKEQLRDKALQIIKSNARNKHVYELSAGISLMMEQFLEERTSSIRNRLENIVVQKLKTIYRKNNLITHIEIGRNFDFNLYQDEIYSSKELITLFKNLGTAGFINLIGTKGEKKLVKLLKLSSISELKNLSEIEIIIADNQFHLYKKIELSRLSRGERQIFILALYWAIIEVSGRNIPFVIDTPYARIDANHRREISEKFFPNISDQVIILSTDEEINDEYYMIIKPHISKEYLLINDENENRTSVENHYFFEV
ncbi:MAG: AAA family ATPase [Lachnospiraceae bacterium]